METRIPPGYLVGRFRDRARRDGLLLAAGYNGTAYYPSTVSPGSSLTIANSSSSYFTLKTMAWVSLLIPVVVAYIAYAWYAPSTASR